MAQWRIEPESKKSIYDSTCYSKDGNKVIVTIVWRGGSFSCKTEGNTFPNLKEIDGNLLDLPDVDFHTWDGVETIVEKHIRDKEIREWLEDMDDSEIDGALADGDNGWESEWSEICIRAFPFSLYMPC